MGKRYSKNESSLSEDKFEQGVFSEEPFREIKGWDKSVRDDLKADIVGCCPDTTLNVNTFNIVLMGERKSGKSSFLNSIYSIFSEKLQHPVEAGVTETRLSRKFATYRIGRDIPIRIGNTMGMDLSDQSQADIRNLLCVVDGHVPKGHIFTSNDDFCYGSQGYIAEPSIADKAHCVAIVVNAETFEQIQSVSTRKLQSLAGLLLDRKVPFVVLLTHPDECCDDLKEDISKIVHRNSLKAMISNINLIFPSLQQDQILPVISYSREVDQELNDSMDILLLYALKAMVDAAQRYLATKSRPKNQPTKPLPRPRSLKTSKPPQHPPDPPKQKPPDVKPRKIFSNEPWRQTKGWGKSTKDELKAVIEGSRPDARLNVNFYNIVLMGVTGSGKSGFYNSLNSIFRDAVIIKAPAGDRAYSLTKEFMRYSLRKDMSIRIGDTMGLIENSTEADIKNIIAAVDGHVPHGFIFTPREQICKQSYIANPTIADQAHCVAIVIDANTSYNMSDKVRDKLKRLVECLESKIPFVILLTHLDVRWPELKQDVTKTFNHNSLKMFVKRIHDMVPQLPKDHIFPVINYQEEVDLEDDMDVLLLSALNAMVDAAKCYLGGLADKTTGKDI